jgi:ATP-binding cassette subfamily B protein
MLRIDARLTALALLPLVVLPLVTMRLGARIHDRFEAVQEHFGAMTTRAQENLAGVRVVRAYRQEQAESARFAALGEEYLRRNMALARLNGLMNPTFQLLAGLGAVVVIGVGGALAARGEISVGAYVAFGFYLGMLTWPMIALGWVINLFQRGAASMGRIVTVLDAPASLARTVAPRALPAASAGRSLEFRDVGFHYPAPEGAAPRWVLRHVSFTLPAGATLGVVGAVGSGKSALIDLVPRLHDPQEGEVLLDGVPLRELDLDALRAEIGYVPQDNLLFSDTIGANIGYGVGDAAPAAHRDGAHAPGDGAADAGGAAERSLARIESATDGASEPASGDAVRWAAGVAQLAETIDELPSGYGTVLGERGVNLSGGQKQRAALARALARRPSVVLLDDALSAVDTHTEAEILRGLRGALAGRTALIASHRVSAIRDASWIIVLDEGRIVEQGRHQDLMAHEGRYAALLRRQQLVAAIEADDVTGRSADAGRDGTDAVRARP